jgi:hypothetical protein
MKCLDAIMNSKLFGLLLHVVASQLVKPSLITSWWGGSVSADFILMTMLGFKKNSLL